MSDYIPTTAEVRDAYSSESSDSKFANRAFDLWLARYKAKIIAQTEERIIKLLEEARDKCACYREVGMPICRHQLSVDEQIALIKGEQK